MQETIIEYLYRSVAHGLWTSPADGQLPLGKICQEGVGASKYYHVGKQLKGSARAVCAKEFLAHPKEDSAKLSLIGLVQNSVPLL